MSMLDELKTNNYAILASNGYFSFDNGIKPVISKLNENIEYFKGLTVADKIIGKASAMLLCLSGVKEVYCTVLSKAGEQVLKKYGVTYHYENMTEIIINRKGDDMCPMEKTVKDIDDLMQAYNALNQTLINLQNK